MIAERFRFYTNVFKQERVHETIANCMPELTAQVVEAVLHAISGTTAQESSTRSVCTKQCRKELVESELTLTTAVHIVQAAETARDKTYALYYKATTSEAS